jgi:glycine C-acetyltransferase
VDLFEKRLTNMGPLGQHSRTVHGYLAFPKLEGEIGPYMTFRGMPMLNWSLNNYIGLANHPEVRKADAEAAAQWGLGAPMGARMMSGNTKYHEQLEVELAQFAQKEDAILLNFGYQGIMSVIDALLDRHDVLIYDLESHACIVDGARLHMGKRFGYAHNDIDNLEKQLQRATRLAAESGGGILVVTEGVFGMSSSVGKLKEIVELKKKYSFRLLVDDAHGFGTMGATGAGVGEALGCQEGIDIYFSTFAKSMASIGAFIAGEKQILNFLRYNTRSQIFAKALPMPLVVGALKRLELLRNQPELREKLWVIVNALQNGLRERGFNIGNPQSPVTPVYMNGNPVEVQNLIRDLRENHHIFCSVVAYPVVPKGIVLMRLIPTAMHSLEDVSRTLDAFEDISRKLQTGVYANAEVPTVVL